MPLQPASPSETVSVSDARPGAEHVSVGFCALALLSVPELVVQWYETACGPASGSLAELEIVMTLPAGGSALTELMFGQMLSVPFTKTEPVVAAS